jgi:hypothetical protein
VADWNPSSSLADSGFPCLAAKITRASSTLGIGALDGSPGAPRLTISPPTSLTNDERLVWPIGDTRRASVRNEHCSAANTARFPKSKAATRATAGKRPRAGQCLSMESAA